MSDGPPPPPPPHGENPKTTAGGGLPPGRYDIFVIPEHSAGSGFLYLPSLQPNINSFVAGFASALACVVLFQSMAPAIQHWWSNFQGMGNMGIFLLMVAIGLGAWAVGRQQGDGSKNSGQNHKRHGSEGRRGPFTSGASGTFGGGPGSYSSSPPPPPPHNGPPPHQHAPPPQSGPPPNQHHQHAPPPPPPPKSDPPPTHHPPPPPPPPPPPEPDPPKPEPPKPAPPKAEPPKPQPPPQPEPKKETPQNAWQKAREETRKREEERKIKEAEQKRREDAARRLRELREKEAREREQREKVKKEKEQQEKEAREREAKEKERLLEETRKREQREKDLRERLERERQLREKLEKEAREIREAKDRLERERKERLEKERKEREAREAKEKEEKLRKEKEEAESKARKGSTYAYSSVGERMSMWPNGRPPAPSSPSQPPSSPRPAAASSQTSTPRPASPATRRPPPTARSATGTSSQTGTSTTGTERESEYSYRPYDKPKRPTHKKSVSDFSETSYAPSQSTARTTPPPSMRGPYATKDPEKIVIKAVYCYLNQFAKTPASQLISGLGTVTDGLILRISTEGLFIDDDIRGVAQREWDVKAWTLKLVEVWCPVHSITAAATAAGTPTPANHTFFKTMPGRRAPGPDRGAPKTLTGDEADGYLADMLSTCKGTCSCGLAPRPAGSSVSGRSEHQMGDWRKKGLHILRATVRDQDGKRYLFVVPEEDSWKVALGLQRLRRGTQVRALGVSNLSPLEAKNILETLGW